MLGKFDASLRGSLPKVEPTSYSRSESHRNIINKKVKYIIKQEMFITGRVTLGNFWYNLYANDIARQVASKNCLV